MNLKKLLSVLLLFAMLMATFCTVTASAEDTFTWTLDEYGTLTVSGTGEVGFGSESSQPWYQVRDQIQTIVVEEGIEILGTRAFSGLKYVTEISIPTSVKSIGLEAFRGCSFLSEITLPAGLESIGYDSFYQCTSLKEITIPKSVTSINNGYYGAFGNCSSLEKVVFEGSLATLPSCFRNCTGLKEITFPKGLIKINAVAFENCSSLEKVVLPDTVTVLGQRVFDGCSSLKKINTENVLEFGGYVFSGCTSLSTVSLHKDLKKIPEGMFANSGITHITFPENLSYEYAGNMPEVFKGCTALTEFTFPENIKSVDRGFFEGCTALTKVTLHNDITEIQSYAFKNCASLKELSLPKNLQKIEYDVFQGSAITEITIPDSLTQVNGYGSVPFMNSNLETVTWEGERTEIPDYLFMGASKLKQVDLENIQTIGAYAFADCTEFVPDLSETTTKMGNYAFRNCAAIKDFAIPDWMETIPDGLLMGTGLTYVAFPDTVKKIGQDAYKNCESLGYIEFSSSVTDIGNYAFYGCTALDGVDIPGTVINIGNSAFQNCENLRQLTMHKGTQNLGNSAFYNCALEEIRPSQTLRSLGDETFNDNPIRIFVVPRFLTEWHGWGNVYQNFNPTYSFVPANVQQYDVYTYKDATIFGVEGTAGEDEALREESMHFTPVTNQLKVLCFDIDTVDISLAETYDAVSVLTFKSEEDPLLPIHLETEIDGEYISFSSDNEDVAVVDSAGYVRGVGYGTANITVSCDSGITDVLCVNVVRPGIGVAVSSGYEMMKVGESVALTADTIPAGCEEIFTWESSDEAIVTVSTDGMVTAVSEGTAVITVLGENSGKSAKCVVEVVGESLPTTICVDRFVAGFDISVSDAESGGTVIAAWYSKNGKILALNVYPAAKTIRATLSVSRDEDLTDSTVKLFRWNSEYTKPLSQFQVVGIE